MARRSNRSRKNRSASSNASSKSNQKRAQQAANKDKQRQQLREQLEPRALFDAALPAPELTTPDATPTEAPVTVDPQLVDDVAVGNETQRKEVVFVDATVENVDALLDEIMQQRQGVSLELKLLSLGEDGVKQIAEEMNGMSGVDAVHIISHGNAGELQLGTGTLSAASMSGQYMQEMLTIRGALSQDADMLIYGCNFGQGAAGSAAAVQLAALTGADIASSDDLTGATALGGDWDLENTVGQVEAAALSASGWTGTLADTTITAAELVSGLDLPNDETEVTKGGNTVTFSQVAGTDGLMNDNPFGVGFARNSDAIETHDLEVTFAGDVNIVELEFGFLNNDVQPANSDGIEQLFDFRAIDRSGNDITSQVTISLDDNSTQGGLSFQAVSNLGPTARNNALVPDGPSGPGDAGSF
ncbi:MAG: DUF4347 domain-containing protein, partial [Planctomycetota bacterium]